MRELGKTRKNITKINRLGRGPFVRYFCTVCVCCVCGAVSCILNYEQRHKNIVFVFFFWFHFDFYYFGLYVLFFTLLYEDSDSEK